MKRLVIGCARSATWYTTKVLRELGLDVMHEGYGKDGSVAWPLTYKHNWYPAYEKKYGSCQPPKYDVVLHQVRRPLKTIASFFIISSPGHWRFICELTPIEHSDSRLDKCVKYWYYWNLHAEERAEMTYRIENLEGVWEEFCKRLVVKGNYKEIKYISKKTNTKPRMKKNRAKKYRRAKNLTWEEIERTSDFYNRVIKLGKRYGYRRLP